MTLRLYLALPLVAAAPALVPTIAAAQQDYAACSDYPVGEPDYACSCGPGVPTGSVWGSNPYTADSSICAAAVHAGVISAEGGAVLALQQDGQSSYAGTDANGVTTRDWGSYGTSFTFNPKGPRAADMATCGAYPLDAAQLDCFCEGGPTGGSVWGSDPYTADSDLCDAARHAGIIGDPGGAVRVLLMNGLEGYSGSESNGIVSRDWGSYGDSITFDWN